METASRMEIGFKDRSCLVNRVNYYDEDVYNLRG